MFKREKLLILKTIKSEILRQIYTRHQGIEKSKIKAGQLEYWLEFNQNIEEIVSRCIVFEKYRRNNSKAKIINYEIPHII